MVQVVFRMVVTMRVAICVGRCNPYYSMDMPDGEGLQCYGGLTMKQRCMLTLAQAAAFLGDQYGRKPSLVTVWRWATKGVDGRVLPTVRLGRYRLTWEDALVAFVEEPAEVNSRQTAPCVTPAGGDGEAFSASEAGEARARRQVSVEQAKAQLRQCRGDRDKG